MSRSHDQTNKIPAIIENHFKIQELQNDYNNYDKTKGFVSDRKRSLLDQKYKIQCFFKIRLTSDFSEFYLDLKNMISQLK